MIHATTAVLAYETQFRSSYIRIVSIYNRVNLRSYVFQVRKRGQDDLGKAGRVVRAMKLSIWRTQFRWEGIKLQDSCLW